MPEPKQVAFTHKEVAEALLRGSDIHEGFWGLYVEFGFAATNVGPQPGSDITPAAIALVQKLGLHRFDEANNLTVDAAVVNPPPKPVSKGRRR